MLTSMWVAGSTFEKGCVVSHAVPLQAGMQPYPGYRLRQLVGRGGFAEVWEAETDRGEPIALKFLACSDNMAATREIRSIQAIKQLRHPYLIRIQDIWTQPGYLVVAMELAEGSLLDLYEAYQEEFRTPVKPDKVCLYLSQVAEALDFLNARRHVQDGHKVGFQHCDIKPSNILLMGNVVKLSDFGLSSPTSSMVRQHRRAGTLDFAAPEVFQGRLSDWTDQYALAVTFCQLYAGRYPFADTPQKFDRAYTRPTPDLSFLPAALRPIVNRALAPVPQNRWPTCGEFMSNVAKNAVR